MALVPTQRWAVLGEFNPDSPQQVLKYCRSRGYKIPKDRKTKKETSSEEALSEILRHHEDPVLPLVIDYKRYTKAISYLEDTYLGKDGRLHPRYTFLPKTGRLSSKAPNLMNLPQGKRKGAEVLKLAADAIRGSFIPDPGYILAEVDWRAIEALLTGFFAGDPDYMRIAKVGVHAFNASYGLHAEGKIPFPADPTWDDEKLDKFLLEIKEKFPSEYADFKKAGYADNYGQGIFSLARDMRCSIEKAKWLKEMIRAAAPKVAAWKDSTLLQAHSAGFLTNPFGHSLSFFEVYKKKSNGNYELGKEATEALAYMPQSTCAAMLREILVSLGTRSGEGQEYQLLVPIHDSLLLQIREDRVREVMEMVKSEMERPWPELGGLVIETEAKVGPTMRKMKTWKD